MPKQKHGAGSSVHLLSAQLPAAWQDLSGGPMGIFLLTSVQCGGWRSEVGWGSRFLPLWGPVGSHQGTQFSYWAGLTPSQPRPLKRWLNNGWELGICLPTLRWIYFSLPLLRCLGKLPWMTPQRSTGTTTSRPFPKLCCFSSGESLRTDAYKHLHDAALRSGHRMQGNPSRRAGKEGKDGGSPSLH